MSATSSLSQHPVPSSSWTTDALAPFLAAGVLAPVDVDVARTLCTPLQGCDERVALAVALAVRAPRVGHVAVELARVPDYVVAEDPDAAASETARTVAWPEPAGWAEAVAASPLVRTPTAEELAAARPGHEPSGDEQAPLGAEVPLDGPLGDARPLVWWDGLLYLDRYWRYEQRLAASLAARAGRALDGVDPDDVRRHLDALAPETLQGDDGLDRQRLAVANAATHELAVITGGPGTGKTTTVATLLGVLLLLGREAQAPPRIALAAPTGKAAQRLTEAIAGQAQALDLQEDERARLVAEPARTLHRLLRRDPGRPTRFRHDADNPLPADVIVVDEASMVSLPLMAKLVDAVAPGARLVLLGDRDQLASVEAGAVLGDLAGPVDHDAPPRHAPEVAARLEQATGQPVTEAAEPAGHPGAWDAIVRLTRSHRFGEDTPIGRLAATIRRTGEDASEALELLENLSVEAGSNVAWRAGSEAEPAPAAVLDTAVEAFRAVADRASTAEADEALAALDKMRVLCAHRRGPGGVAWWNEHVEAALAGPRAAEGPWYPGRPVLVVENAPELDLANGDVGVVVADGSGGGGLQVAFPDGEGGTRFLRPSRLPAHETTYAMTIHKSQGSEYDHAVVVLPTVDSPICTRELVYTAVTRTRGSLTVVADREVLERALSRRIQRPSGLERWLWS